MCSQNLRRVIAGKGRDCALAIERFNLTVLLEPFNHLEPLRILISWYFPLSIRVQLNLPRGYGLSELSTG